MVKSDPEFTAVPKRDRLDVDEDSDPSANALTESITDDGVVFIDADDEDLDKYRDLDGPIWDGSE